MLRSNGRRSATGNRSQIKGALFELVPVGPDWTSPKRLLGFRTPFGETRKRADGSETNDSYDVTETLGSFFAPATQMLQASRISRVRRNEPLSCGTLLRSISFADGGHEHRRWSNSARLVDPQSLVTISEVLQNENDKSPEAKSVKLLVQNGQPLRLPSNLFFIGTVMPTRRPTCFPQRCLIART